MANHSFKVHLIDIKRYRKWKTSSKKTPKTIHITSKENHLKFKTYSIRVCMNLQNSMQRLKQTNSCKYIYTGKCKCKYIDLHAYIHIVHTCRENTCQQSKRDKSVSYCWSSQLLHQGILQERKKNRIPELFLEISRAKLKQLCDKLYG